jgi:lipopolysaccharide export system protein LptC
MASAAPAMQPLDPAADAARLQEAVRQWRRRSQLIHVMRRALPGAIVLIMLGLLVTIAVQTLGRRRAPEGEIAVRMLNPNFRGRDEHGRAYVLSAREAVRDAANFQRVLLTDPVLELQTSPDKPAMRVAASRGVYLENTLVMTLEGKVKMDDPTGWTFRTERAVIDTRRDLISGDTRIEGESATRRISGDSYAIYNRGERVYLRGSVRSTILRGG